MNTRQNFKLAVSVVETNRKTQSEYAVLSDLSDLTAYHSVFKREEILIHRTKWMKLEDVMLSEIRQ